MHVKYFSQEREAEILVSDGGTNRRAYIRGNRINAAPHLIWGRDAVTYDGLRDAKSLPDELIVAEQSGVYLYQGL
jgi:hypothetical protein